MSISEQIEYLKKLSNIVIYDSELGMHESEFQDAIGEAADTIEALSAKLQAKEYCDGCPGADIIEIPCTEECKRRHFKAENMQRSAEDCGGGWIPCKDRLPEEKGWYLVYAKNQRPFVAYFKGKTFPLNNHYHEIIAWQPLPEPYHEP